jgi:hypothetical protein
MMTMSDAPQPQKRNLLVLSRPPRPLDVMSDTEIDEWVAKVYAGMKAGFNKSTGATAPGTAADQQRRPSEG